MYFVFTEYIDSIDVAYDLREGEKANKKRRMNKNVLKVDSPLGLGKANCFRLFFA
jgi:hypothetical protein